MSADPPRLFAYGTLQPGRLRWPALAPYAIGHRPALVPGRLFDSGAGWPVASFDRGADAAELVPGTLIDIDPARGDEALARLDDVEATATDLLRRVAVTTTDGEAAWAYHCEHPPAGSTRIAVWDPAAGAER